MLRHYTVTACRQVSRVPCVQIQSFWLLALPRMAMQQNQNQNLNGLQRLNELKLVLLVDDSMSMDGPRWTDAREALASVADIAAKHDSDGLDVYFLNNPIFRTNIRDGQSVKQLFDAVTPNGQTPTGEKLEEIFNKYIPLLEDRRRSHKPIVIIVITDGVPTDEPKDVIIRAARRLDDNKVPPNQMGVQFAQIGDDEDATIALKELDDDIADQNGVRDMVDTTPYSPNDRDLQFTTDTMIKILLGAIDKLLDAKPNRLPNIQRPASGNGYY